MILVFNVRDSAFGPFLCIGKGGTDIEQEKEVVFIPLEFMGDKETWLKKAGIPENLRPQFSKLMDKLLELVKRIEAQSPGISVKEPDTSDKLLYLQKPFHRQEILSWLRLYSWYHGTIAPPPCQEPKIVR